MPDARADSYFLEALQRGRTLGSLPFRSMQLERVMGIEPTPAAWEAAVLPLNYTRIYKKHSIAVYLT